MFLHELDYSYPEHLVATHPQRPSRILLSKSEEDIHSEINKKQLLDLFDVGDILLLNNTKVQKLRVFAKILRNQKILDKEIEVLFLRSQDTEQKLWQVLFPISRLKINDKLLLPKNIELSIVENSRPILVQASESLKPDFFMEFGQVPLPPYIQKARGQRESNASDDSWYQTAWAKHFGSSAAPTASLHFDQKDLNELKEKSVQVLELTLHIGLGTFLPVQVEDLNQHNMHSEYCEIENSVWQKVLEAKANGKKIWALGTTVCRSLESAAAGKLQIGSHSLYGETNLLIQDPYEFKIVDRLLTNFHQPKSTLIALVMAFAGRKRVLSVYNWAIQQEFRLFSYGDLSVWYPKIR